MHPHVKPPEFLRLRAGLANLLLDFVDLLVPPAPTPTPTPPPTLAPDERWRFESIYIPNATQKQQKASMGESLRIRPADLVWRRGDNTYTSLHSMASDHIRNARAFLARKRDLRREYQTKDHVEYHTWDLAFELELEHREACRQAKRTYDRPSAEAFNTLIDLYHLGTGNNHAPKGAGVRMVIYPECRIQDLKSLSITKRELDEANPFKDHKWGQPVIHPYRGPIAEEGTHGQEMGVPIAHFTRRRT